MKFASKLASVSALALMLASPAFAQSAILGIDSMDDQIEDIERDIARDMDDGEDANRRGSNQYAQGWTGSISLGLAATSGNTDTVDFVTGGRFRYGAGKWNHTLGFAGQIAEDQNIRNKEEAFLTYDVNRYVTENAYIFGMGSVRYDDFASNKWDAFLGMGPGYRVINTEDLTWRIQAGPGVRYIEDQTGKDTTEVSGIASSRFYSKINDMAFLTNDTDVLFSDDSTLILNDIGVNFQMTKALATRVSLRTKYDTDPLPTKEHYDNSFNVSLVVGF